MSQSSAAQLRDEALRRPVMRYHGSKFWVANDIIKHFPKHDTYLEPFCGGAGVLLRKPRSRVEVANDGDGEVINVFRVMQDKAGKEELERLIRLTPFHEDEHRLSYESCDNPVEQARRTIVRSFFGFGSDGITRNSKTGFRASGFTARVTPAVDWSHYPDYLESFRKRLEGVLFLNRDAFEVIETYDGENVLMYVDPPYVHSTRYHPDNRKNYRFEMSDTDHVRLAESLMQRVGMVIISGYDCELYRDLYQGWKMVSFRAMASGDKGGAVERTECLWLSPRTVEAQRQLKLEI